MFFWGNLCLFSLLQIVVIVRAQFSTETCVEIDHHWKSAELLCDGGYISDVTVQSGTGRCLVKNGRCFGLTPSLLVDQLNCYWRNDCVVNWPNEVIVYTADKIDRTCIGRLPTFMSIRYKCFKPSDRKEDGGLVSISKHDVRPKRFLLDICSELEGSYSFDEMPVYSDDVGIIRSHKLYPWDYSAMARKCVVKLYRQMDLVLFITVQSLDLSEGDKLVIQHQNGKLTNVNQSGSHFIFSEDLYIYLNFSVGIESISGKGFLLCFRIAAKTDKLAENACDSIMTDGIIGNTEPAADDPFAIQILRGTPPTTVSAPSPARSGPPLPERCLKKETDRAKAKCAERVARRRENRRQHRGQGMKRRRKQRKRDRRKRRHSARRNT